jgi:NETI protein
MGKKKNKVRFELLENETIDECLNRMKQEGYVPVGKYEKPIFKEVIKEDGKVAYEPIRQQIVFEGKLMNDK